MARDHPTSVGQDGTAINGINNLTSYLWYPAPLVYRFFYWLQVLWVEIFADDRRREIFNKVLNAE